MPYVEGESLRSRLVRERQLPVAEAVRIATDVADALDYAHRHGVIHRDIKPENILLHDGRPVVADFGIALAVQQAGGERMTQTGLSLGTPQYMAPEQATGERSVDLRADVYALGAVTYEMLAPRWSPDGRRLFYRSGQRILEVSVSISPELTLGELRVVFQGDFVNVPGRSFALSPDGRRVLVIEGGVGETRRLRMVQGWLAEVARLTPDAEDERAMP